MNRMQRVILVATLLLIALFLHTLCCDWITGEHYRVWDRRLLFSFGFGGIFARSRDTLIVDAVLGIAMPLALLGTGLFLVAGHSRAAAAPNTSDSS